MNSSSRVWRISTLFQELTVQSITSSPLFEQVALGRIWEVFARYPKEVQLQTLDFWYYGLKSSPIEESKEFHDIRLTLKRFFPVDERQALLEHVYVKLSTTP
jgi:hypothetical protein